MLGLEGYSAEAVFAYLNGIPAWLQIVIFLAVTEAFYFLYVTNIKKKRNEPWGGYVFAWKFVGALSALATEAVGFALIYTLPQAIMFFGIIGLVIAYIWVNYLITKNVVKEETKTEEKDRLEEEEKELREEDKKYGFKFREGEKVKVVKTDYQHSPHLRGKVVTIRYRGYDGDDSPPQYYRIKEDDDNARWGQFRFAKLKKSRRRK